MEFSLKQEILNLNRDPEIRREALSLLRIYIQKLDPESIAPFLSYLKELQERQGYSPYIISLYGILVREHGKLIIAEIAKIMFTLMKALACESPSLTLQESCAKVVSTLARYTVDFGSRELQRNEIIRNIAYPLFDSLLGTAESVAEGAAMCLVEFVGTETWKYASDEIVNDACLRVTGALQDKNTQTVWHMRLVCALARKNSLILEAYGTSLMKSASTILISTNNTKVNLHWQLRLSAITMVYTLLQFVNMESFDWSATLLDLQSWVCDGMPAVREVACEALELVESYLSEIGDKNYLYLEKRDSSETVVTNQSGIFHSADVSSCLVNDSSFLRSPRSEERLNHPKLGMDASKYVPSSYSVVDSNSSASNILHPKHGGSPFSEGSSSSYRASCHQKRSESLSVHRCTSQSNFSGFNDNADTEKDTEQGSVGSNNEIFMNRDITDANVDNRDCFERIHIHNDQFQNRDYLIPKEERHVPVIQRNETRALSVGPFRQSKFSEDNHLSEYHGAIDQSMLNLRSRSNYIEKPNLESSIEGDGVACEEWKTIGVNHIEMKLRPSPDVGDIPQPSPVNSLGSRWTFIWDTLSNGCGKLLNILECISKGSLCLVLVIPATMIAVKLCTTDEQQFHLQVPT